MALATKKYPQNRAAGSLKAVDRNSGELRSGAVNAG
jgi:hypothetical protein